jgi:hypothetical protein
VEVFLFAIPKAMALGRADSKQQRVDALNGMVHFTLGLHYLMQTPNTERAKREASRLMVALLDKAFMPGTHKGTGAKGLRVVLPVMPRRAHPRARMCKRGHVT